ncbi:hypothetical protein D9M73_125220 [compost metagenome]
MLEADRLQQINAPASAPIVEGGVGAQKSSQISAWNTKCSRSLAANSRSVPNGAVWPATVMWHGAVIPAPLANQRFS